MNINICKIITLTLLFAWVYSPVAAVALSVDNSEETLLMFVGETEPIVTVASRYPESPTTAPAIVDVVGREQIDAGGYSTLAELLRDQTGFFMQTSGRGTIPYLSGMRDSILFLYDGVPITTGINKEIAALDGEISLAAIERVEIVRGPGSVLWGVDAFAGVVNLVPRRLHKGTTQCELNAGVGTQQNINGSFSLGAQHDYWSGLLSLSGKRQQFSSANFTTLSGAGKDEIEPSEYMELVSTVSYSDWLQFSGRWSDYRHNYTMQNGAGDILWEGSKKSPFNFLKISASHVWGASHYALTGYYQAIDYKVLDADVERAQHNRVSYIEMLWDRRVLQRGLITAGVSWRHNSVNGALIRDGFQPDFLQPDEPLFTQNIDQADFSSDIYSLFSQFRYRWGNSQWWLGGRFEKHSEYAASLSSSMGVQVPLKNNIHFKMVYGTAFRSPYSSQLFEDESLQQEQIKTVSSRLTWTSANGQRYALTLFHSSFKHHRSEDPYGGLSLESQDRVYGAALDLHAPITQTLSASIGLFWSDKGDAEERYSVLDYSIIRPDGNRIDVFDDWSQSRDYGPEWMARLSLNWQRGAGENLMLTLTAAAEIEASYDKATIIEHCSSPLLVSVVYNRPGFFRPENRISLKISNLFDREYQQPDVYGLVDGEPLSIILTWRYVF